jgi:hypothetical protein
MMRRPMRGSIPRTSHFERAGHRRFPDIQIWTGVFCWRNTGAFHHRSVLLVRWGAPQGRIATFLGAAPFYKPPHPHARNAGNRVRTEAVHLNCGTVGTPMCGGGSGATLLAFPIPLGSVTVLIEVPIAAPRAALGRPNPPPRANEAVVEAKTMKITEASFTAVFDIGKLHQNSRPDRNVSLKATGTIKLKFRSITVRSSRQLYK